MARNDDRRRALADAGLEVLADTGARGLTHRAVDRAAGVPVGTTTNYFRSRSALLTGLVERIYERLAPSDDFIAERAGRTPTRELFAEYLRNIVERLMANRTVTSTVGDRMNPTGDRKASGVLLRARMGVLR